MINKLNDILYINATDNIKSCKVMTYKVAICTNVRSGNITLTVGYKGFPA
uniref:Uncharacterized protein n=1 Tax=Arion vulgaris TaxID=1028688 RepID=A0A0B7AAB5_9EUPU